MLGRSLIYPDGVLHHFLNIIYHYSSVVDLSSKTYIGSTRHRYSWKTHTFSYEYRLSQNWTPYSRSNRKLCLRHAYEPVPKPLDKCEYFFAKFASIKPDFHSHISLAVSEISSSKLRKTNRTPNFCTWSVSYLNRCCLKGSEWQKTMS